MSNITNLITIMEYNKAEAACLKRREDLYAICIEGALLLDDGISTQEVVDYIAQTMKILIK